MESTILPSLLDKLTDHNRRKNNDSGRKAITINTYKKMIFIDVISILNTTTISDDFENEMPEQVKKSTLCYGIPAFTGVNTDDLDWGLMQDSIAEKIRYYEPRLIPDSVNVEIQFDYSYKDTNIIFVISGVLVGSNDQKIALKTSMDMDSKSFKILDEII